MPAFVGCHLYVDHMSNHCQRYSQDPLLLLHRRAAHCGAGIKKKRTDGVVGGGEECCNNKVKVKNNYRMSRESKLQRGRMTNVDKT